MPNKYIKEMIADWKGAGLAQGFYSPNDDPWKETREWYKKNKNNMRLHKNVVFLIDTMLKV